MKVFFWRSHIKPVATKRIAIDSFTQLEEEWEEPSLKHVVAIYWHMLQNFWLKDVDASIYPVGGYLIAARLFNEALHPAITIGFNHPKGGGVIYPGQGYGYLSPLMLMKGKHISYIKSSEDVPVENDKGGASEV